MTSRAQLALIPAVLSACVSGAGCTWQLGDNDGGEGGFARGPDESAVIVGELGWTDIIQLSDVAHERRTSRAVGYLSIPARGQRCTAFLVAPDVVMTNHHCIGEAWAAEGASVSFAKETDVPVAAQQRYTCDEFLTANEELDYALLRCTDRPGDDVGVLGLDESEAHAGDDIYVLHQNCDYYADRWCDPVKRYSPGELMHVYNELRHSADTLGGSSGAPLLSSSSHEVIGLHHVGLNNDGGGRGTGNLAVPMWRIVPHVLALFPELELGARLPGGQPVEGTPPAEETPTEGPAMTEPVDGSGEAFEPNESAASAATIAAPLSWDGLAIVADDTDWFVFDSDGGEITVRIEFIHAMGDLDLFVHKDTGAVTGQSVSVDDVEELALTLPVGRYHVRVAGYAGATGAYNLRLR